MYLTQNFKIPRVILNAASEKSFMPCTYRLYNAAPFGTRSSIITIRETEHERLAGGMLPVGSVFSPCVKETRKALGDRDLTQLIALAPDKRAKTAFVASSQNVRTRIELGL